MTNRSVIELTLKFKVVKEIAAGPSEELVLLAKTALIPCYNYSIWEHEFKLQGNSEDFGQEPLCKQFRQLRYEETAGPREALSQLQELC
jgi:hypothetical protein